MSTDVEAIAGAAQHAVDLRPLPDRRYEAVVFDWDGTAVPDRAADTSALRQRMAELSARAVHQVVVTGTHIENVDDQLALRPTGPGTVHLCVNRGSEVYELGRHGPRLTQRRQATDDENACLDRAAAAVVDRLRASGLAAEVVSARLNRRKIDLLPEPEWADPPKARISELVSAVERRLHAAGITGLGAVVAMARQESCRAGLADPRVTSDAKHVEIGLTDKSHSAAWAFGELARRGIAPGLVLAVGDEFGPLGDAEGSDALLLVDAAARATAVSVGIEPGGVPPGVIHVGGGPEAFITLLDDQLTRRRNRRVPTLDDDPRWALCLHDDPRLRRVHETLTTLSNGSIGMRGAREEDGPGTEPSLLANGVYDGTDRQSLLPGPDWSALVVPRAPLVSETVQLDLRTGVLLRERAGSAALPVRTFRFVSAARPAACVLRAEGPASRLAGGDVQSAQARSAGGGGITVAVGETETIVDGLRCIERLAAVLPGIDRLVGHDDAAAELRRLADDGFDVLLAEHRAAWSARWDDAQVDIEGDPEAELATRFALFHLLASVPSNGEAAVGARGLSGLAYGGHVFWDADVFVLPVLAATHPEAARAMLEYRIARLPAARRIAQALGREGARFAWESARDGDDVTPLLGRGAGGELVPIRTGLREDHIAADVAWAVVEYAAWSGDDELLRGPALALLTDAARFWASRVRWDRTGRAHVYGVVGPDEYHEVVDDNAYTNVMARWTLRRAAELVGGTEEAADWRRVADALVDGFDPVTGRHEEFAGFWRLEPLIVADVASVPVAADMLFGRHRVLGAQIVKQPDVLMLHHLVPEEMPAGSLGADLDYYGPRTAHGSSLSPAIQAAVLARAGRPEEALALFRTAARLDLDDLTGTTAAGLHLGALAGVWHALTYGFAGLRPRIDALQVDPVLPSAWSCLQLRLRFRGARVRLALSRTEVEIEADRPIPVVVRGSRPRFVHRATLPLRPGSPT